VTDTPPQPEAHGVHIDAQPGSAVISLDGIPLPAGQVTAYTLHHDVQASLPTLVLHTRQPAGTAFDGLARVAVAEQDPTAAVIAFLQSVDPAALEAAALNRDDLGPGRYDLTRAMLRQLIDCARGDQ
jgi:hypothetical protein